jgi:selenium donor protein
MFFLKTTDCSLVMPPTMMLRSMTLVKERALISTVDFFAPIVDDAFTYGQIAAANSLSDVYAMGGKPLMAMAVLGWPTEKLPTVLAQRIMAGAKDICLQAGVIIAGGHTIDSPEPFFGLSVNGEAPIAHIKQNSTAQAGDMCSSLPNPSARVCLPRHSSAACSHPMV